MDDSEEDDDDDESTEESVEVKKAPKNLQKIAIEKIVKKPIAKNNKDLHPVNEDDSDEVRIKSYTLLYCLDCNFLQLSF